MKVVHLLTTDLGGTYKAVERIHKGLLLKGIDSKVLLRTKMYEDNVGEELIDTAVKKLFSKAKNVLNLMLSKGQCQTEIFGTNVSKLQQIKEADIVVVHWCNSFVSDYEIERLTRLDKPIIVMAHDMWYFTGGCHTDGGCGRYHNECQVCPYINWAHVNFLRKKEKYKRVDTLIVPSNWSKDVALGSNIWNESNITIEVINNPIDKEIYRQLSTVEVEVIKDKYGVSKCKKIILFGATKTIGNDNKGLNDLKKIFEKLVLNKNMSNKYQLVVFGNNDTSIFENIPIETKFIGYIHGDEAMCEVYNMADVYINLSKQESFCYTVAEALACSTKVVAYGVGGILDQITHKQNGYLADYGDVDEIARGIEYVLSHDLEELDINNNISEIGQKYKDLFTKIIENNK